MYMDSASYYLSQKQDEVDDLQRKLNICKRALAWQWNGDTDVDQVDWDSFFSAAEEK